MASNSQAPASDNIDVVALVAPPVVFYAIALTMFSLRIYSRSKSTGLQIDDALLAISMVLATAFLAFCSLSVHYGLGKANESLTLHQRGMGARMGIARAEAWNWGTTALKLSMSAMILRIRGDRIVWRRSLYAFSAFLIALAITSSAWDFTTCIPLEAAWNFSYDRSHCRPRRTSSIYVLVGGIIYTLTDLVFAILPLFFIPKINRPMREKLVLCFLMGLGLLCTAASIPKFRSYVVSMKGGNNNKNRIGVVLWSQLELFIGITAASIPVLRTLFEGTLRKIGISITNTARGVSSRSWTRPNRLTQTFEMTSSIPKRGSREADSESFHELATTWEVKDGSDKRAIGVEVRPISYHAH